MPSHVGETDANTEKGKIKSMNSHDIFDGVTDIRDDLIDAAIKPEKGKKRRRAKRWTVAAAALLAVAVSAGVFLRPGVWLKGYAIAEAEYPKTAPYPGGDDQFNEAVVDAWYEDNSARRNIEVENREELEKFFAKSSQTFLTDAEGDQNRVYSPLNVYMALSMLAQLTGGESREQILNVLGSKDMKTLHQQVSDVWNVNYRDDGAVTSILASSLWLNKDVKFNSETMDTLAADFYASSYRGEMGSERFNKVFRSWLNEQTGGLLKDKAESIEMDSRTVLALATTLYFNAKWDYEFIEENTVPKVFHAAGGDVETDFMRQQEYQNYYFGDKFSAVSQQFAGGGEMWFVLPDEGGAATELLLDEETVDFLFCADKYEWKNSKYLYVNKFIPKFDVSSQFDLCKGFQSLGITDVFDEEKSDFTSMTADTDFPVILSEAKHAARVVIDEKGCTATAFTAMLMDGMGMPSSDEIDFVLDRPFLFCITGDSGMPLFVGVVNTPLEK